MDGLVAGWKYIFNVPLVASPMNRIRPLCFVLVGFETTVNRIVTQDLIQDGGPVLSYCHVQCGVVEVVADLDWDIQIYPYPLIPGWFTNEMNTSGWLYSAVIINPVITYLLTAFT